MTADEYARMLYSLLPHGKLWRVIGSKLYELFLGNADELVRLHGRLLDLIEESDPTTADELLPEYEEELGLTAAATLEERRAAIVARQVRRQRFRPIDFFETLAPLLNQDVLVEDEVIERAPEDAVVIDDAREIFRFFVFRNPALPGTYYLQSAQAVIDAMKPSHTSGTAIESINFLCDDPHSLCDRDILGA